MGALNRIVAFNRVNKKTLTVYECKLLLKDIVENNTKVLNIEKIKGNIKADGVLITATIRNGPAENAGVMPGDIVLSVDGKNTNSPEQIIGMITKLKPGMSVKIKILRGWEERGLTAVILQRPAIRFPL